MQISGLTTNGVLFNPAGIAGFRSSSLVQFKFRPLPYPDSSRFNKAGTFIGCPYIGRIGLDICQVRSLKVRALNSSDDNIAPIAPLKLESPPGLLLSQILQTQPRLLPSAVDEQLKNLQADRDNKKVKGPPVSNGNLLYRRIANIKEKERQKALEEIIYCLVVQKFMEHDISMIPTIKSSSDATFLVDTWCNEEFKLENIHSRDALEMIQDHISLVLGQRVVGPIRRIVQMSKLRLGKLYAASAMYGYFLKRVDERYQLEKTMKIVPTDKKVSQTSLDELKPGAFWDLRSMLQKPTDDDFDGKESKSYSLRSYCMYMDVETSQRYATIRSKESISLIEKQTQALLGRPDIRIAEDGSLSAQNDEVTMMSFSGLTTLVLEAAAFGSFLWVAEGYVESKYPFLSF